MKIFFFLRGEKFDQVVQIWKVQQICGLMATVRHIKNQNLLYKFISYISFKCFYFIFPYLYILCFVDKHKRKMWQDCWQDGAT